MKKFTFSALAMTLLILTCMRAFADITLLDSEKNKLQLTGFIKLDAVYQDGGINGLTIPRYAAPGGGNFFLTATHSRFGLKYAGTPLANGINVSAVVEWDFLDTSSPNQMKPRFRQGFFSLSKNGQAVLFGQAWDIFSPLGPNTMMTNGYLWQTGNLGFRHAQVRYSYSGKNFDFALSVNDPATSGGWKNKFPVLQARLGLKFPANSSVQIGLSGIYGRELAESAGVAFKNKVNVAGVSLDWNLTFSKSLSLKGEYAQGENLTYVSSRSAVFTDALLQQFTAKKVSAFWSELLFAKDKFSSWLGYAFEDLSDESQMALNELKKTGCLLAGIQYGAGSGVSFGLEFAHFLSQPFQTDNIRTNQIVFSAILNL